jgi:hypothetical protein
MSKISHAYGEDWKNTYKILKIILFYYNFTNLLYGGPSNLIRNVNFKIATPHQARYLQKNNSDKRLNLAAIYILTILLGAYERDD